jgi:hypothetical protein
MKKRSEKLLPGKNNIHPTGSVMDLLVAIRTGVAAIAIFATALNASAQVIVTPIEPGVRAATTPANEIISPPGGGQVSQVSVRANSIAVDEIVIKREYREFFYDEKLKATSTFKGQEKNGFGISSPGTPGTGKEVPAYDTPARQAAFRNVDEQGGGTYGRASAFASKETSVEASESVDYSKSFGFKKTVSYAELRGLLADMRSTLVEMGYVVIRPKPIDFSKENESPMSLTDRIRNGDFYGAEFVLIPKVVNAIGHSSRERIQGTRDFSNRLDVSLTAEITIFSPKTNEVLASFNVQGLGSDMYLGDASATFVPNKPRILSELFSSFSADARRNLRKQLPVVTKSSRESEVKPATVADRVRSEVEADSATLKVYRDPDVAGGKKETSPEQNELKVYRR